MVGVRVCTRKSDSSAQVLRNARSEFRLLMPLVVDVFIFCFLDDGKNGYFVQRKRFRWYKVGLLMRFVPRKRFRWYKISVLYGVVVGRRRLSDVDCVSVGIGGTENLV